MIGKKSVEISLDFYYVTMSAAVLAARRGRLDLDWTTTTVCQFHAIVKRQPHYGLLLVCHSIVVLA